MENQEFKTNDKENEPTLLGGQIAPSTEIDDDSAAKIRRRRELLAIDTSFLKRPPSQSTRPCIWRQKLHNELEVHFGPLLDDGNDLKSNNADSENGGGKVRKRFTKAGLVSLIANFYEKKIKIGTVNPMMNKRNMCEFIVMDKLQEMGSGMKASAIEQIGTLMEDVIEHRFQHPRIELFSYIIGIPKPQVSEGPDETKTNTSQPSLDIPWSPVYSELLLFMIHYLYCEKEGHNPGSISERLEILPNGSCWLGEEQCRDLLTVLFSENTGWNFNYWDSCVTDYKISEAWQEPIDVVDNLWTRFENMLETPQGKGYVGNDLKKAKHIVDADVFFLFVMKSWFRQQKRLFIDLERGEEVAFLKDVKEFNRKKQRLEDAQNRPWTAEEVININKGVRKFGNPLHFEQLDDVWSKILHHKEYDFIHRLNSKLAERWTVIFNEKVKREAKKWNWQNWVWDTDWDWGSLVVAPEGCGESNARSLQSIRLQLANEGQDHIMNENFGEDDDISDDEDMDFDTSEEEGESEDDEEESKPIMGDRLMMEVLQALENRRIFTSKDFFKTGKADDIPTVIKKVFARMDKNDTSGIQADEFELFLKKLGLFLDAADVSHLLHIFDRNDDGSISFEEFLWSMEKYFAQYLRARVGILSTSEKINRKGRLGFRDFKTLLENAGRETRISVELHLTYLKKAMRILKRAKINNSTNFVQLFTNLDADHSGKLTREELFEGLRKIGITELDKKMENALWCHFDPNDSGTVTTGEFTWAIFNNDLMLRAFEIAEAGLWDDTILQALFFKHAKEHERGAFVMEDNATVREHEFIHILRELKIPYAQTIWTSLDVNTDNELNFREFMLFISRYRLSVVTGKHATDIVGAITKIQKFFKNLKESRPENIKNPNVIERIDLKNNQLSETTAHSLYHLLQLNPKVKSLDLSRNRIYHLGCSSLSRWLVDPRCSLKEINLSNNDLSDESISRLSIGLHQCSSLSYLNLSHNRISLSGVKYIQGVLENSNTKLSHLDLSWNRIDYRAAESLAEGLKSNSSLRQLSLQYNSVKEMGYIHLLKGLEGNRGLHILDISFNGNCTTATCDILATSLRENKHLKVLKLNGNNIDDNGARMLLASKVFHHESNAEVSEIDPQTYEGKMLSTLLKVARKGFAYTPPQLGDSEYDEEAYLKILGGKTFCRILVQEVRLQGE
eukprot:g1261.t1